MVHIIVVAGICSTVILALFGLSIYLMSTVNPEEIVYDDESNIPSAYVPLTTTKPPVPAASRTQPSRRTNITNENITMDTICYVAPKASVKGRRSIIDASSNLDKPGVVLQIIDDSGEARIEIVLHPRRSMKKKSRKKKHRQPLGVVQPEGTEVVRNSVIKIMPDDTVVLENVEVLAEDNILLTSDTKATSNVSAILVSKNPDSNNANENKTESVTLRAFNVSDAINKDKPTSNVHNSTNHVLNMDYTKRDMSDILNTGSTRSLNDSTKDIVYTKYTKHIHNSTTQSTINVQNLTNPILNTETARSTSDFTNDIFKMEYTKQLYYTKESTESERDPNTSHDLNKKYTQNVRKSSDYVNMESATSIRNDDHRDYDNITSTTYPKPLISILPYLSKSVTASTRNVLSTTYIFNTKATKIAPESTTDILITRTIKNIPDDPHDILKRKANTKVSKTTKSIVNTLKEPNNDNAKAMEHSFENSVTDYQVRSKSALVSSTLGYWGY